MREAQAEATRSRILDATILVIGEGIATLSIPAVAERAGVSVPTVYRYFPDKETLLEEAAVHVRKRIGVGAEAPSLSGVTEYLDMHRRIFQRFAESDTQTIGAVVATFGRGDGAMNLEQRREWLTPTFAEHLATWPDADRDSFLTVIAMLSSSIGATAMAHFGIRGDDAADLLAWVVERLLASEGAHADPTTT